MKFKHIILAFAAAVSLSACVEAPQEEASTSTSAVEREPDGDVVAVNGTTDTAVTPEPEAPTPPEPVANHTVTCRDAQGRTSAQMTSDTPTEDISRNAYESTIHINLGEDGEVWQTRPGDCTIVTTYTQPPTPPAPAPRSTR